ncbi:MAG: HD domain-containing protein [bacterium]|jgi:hypothetical protein
MEDLKESGLGATHTPQERPAASGSVDINETETDEALQSDSAGRASIRDRFLRVNKELWLILGILAIAGAMNYLVTAKRMIIAFYAMPTLYSAYFYGRRHAVLTAFASVFLIGLLTHFNPEFLNGQSGIYGIEYDLMVWGGTLVLTAYAMGTLHERERRRIDELRETYQGLLVILRQLVCNDSASENHAHRVSNYASTIAEYHGLKAERIEDVRAASLLHDIAGLETSRNLLEKASRTMLEEPGPRAGRRSPKSRREPAVGRIHRIVPIILGCRLSYDSRRNDNSGGEEIPLEARIIKVADAYDSLITDRPGRKAISPLEAKNVIDRESGSEFDPTVVHAFKRAFRKGDLGVPELLEQHSDA